MTKTKEEVAKVSEKPTTTTPSKKAKETKAAKAAKIREKLISQVEKAESMGTLVELMDGVDSEVRNSKDVSFAVFNATERIVGATVPL